MLAGVVNLTPSFAVLSNSHVVRLYAISALDADLALLLRHRAILFAAVALLLFWAALDVSLRTAAGVVGLVSMFGYVLMYVLISPDNTNLLKVAWVDVVAGGILVAGLVCHLLWHR